MRRGRLSIVLCLVSGLLLGATAGGARAQVDEADLSWDPALDDAPIFDGETFLDGRDANPDFAFTAPPTLRPTLRGEYARTRLLILAMPESSLDLLRFMLTLVELTAPTKVLILVDGLESETEVRLGLQDRGIPPARFVIQRMEIGSIWVRDYGPTIAFQPSGRRVVLDWRYFGEDRSDDDVVPTRLAKLWGLPVVRPPLRLEGGNLLSDGRGRCIVSEQLLTANPWYDEPATRQLLQEYAGCRRTSIVPGLPYESTGHVDMLALVTGRRQVLVAEADPERHPVTAERLERASQILKADGFIVDRIPMPENADGATRTYTNVVIVDGAVIVPTYHDDRARESEALAIIGAAFPRRAVRTIDATSMIEMGGMAHCATLTIPR